MHLTMNYHKEGMLDIPQAYTHVTATQLHFSSNEEDTWSTFVSVHGYFPYRQAVPIRIAYASAQNIVVKAYLI
jgi:hypothetical protein